MTVDLSPIDENLLAEIANMPVSYTHLARTPWNSPWELASFLFGVALL